MNPVTELRFIVPLVPPSVNHYKKPCRGASGQHRFYITPEAKAFKEALALCARRRSVIGPFYEVMIELYLGRDRRGDADNFFKVILDGMVDAGVIHSDAAVKRLCLELFRDQLSPRTEIVVLSRSNKV